MSNIKIFEKAEFGEVRIVTRDGEPWFVGMDVAKALGYQFPSQAVQDHCKKINKITQVSDLADQPPVNLAVIPESDVYRLIMRSHLPSAEAFQDWVCEEVLPAIRGTGAYLPNMRNFSSIAEAAEAYARECRIREQVAAERDEAIEERNDAIFKRNMAISYNGLNGVLYDALKKSVDATIEHLLNRFWHLRDDQAVAALKETLSCYEDLCAGYNKIIIQLLRGQQENLLESK